MLLQRLTPGLLFLLFASSILCTVQAQERTCQLDPACQEEGQVSDAMKEIMSAMEADSNKKALRFVQQSTPTNRVRKKKCNSGLSGGVFECSNVDLAAYIPLSEFDSVQANDIWGYLDAKNGREYAILGLKEGTAFIDITDPLNENPLVLGILPAPSANSLWRDVKVYKHYALIVTEAPNSGLQVFDLKKLRSSSVRNEAASSGPVTFEEDGHYTEFSRAHNIVVNEDTKRAYAVGTNTCGGGLHAIDISDPENPSYIGCLNENGYTHDAQCVVYDGPDTRYKGDEICLGFNEDHFAISKMNGNQFETLSTTSYSRVAYTHQGWLTTDHKFLVINDELDERRANTDKQERTRSLLFDVRDLEDPKFIKNYISTETAIDHNLYLTDDHIFEANYCAGLRILEIKNMKKGNVEEVAFFDVEPDCDDLKFHGSWSSYPYLPSGHVPVSSYNQGFFLLTPRLGKPGVVVDLKRDGSESTSSSLLIRWKKPKTFGIADCVQLEFKEIGGSYTRIGDCFSAVNKRRIKNLTADTKYKVRARGVNAKGKGNWKVITAKTKQED